MNEIRWKRLSILSGMLVVLGVQPTTAKELATLDIFSDAPCQLMVNGQANGVLQTGTKRSIRIPAGGVDLVCTAQGDITATAKVDAQQGVTTLVRMRLRWDASDDRVIDKLQRQEWSRSDNGSDVDWTSAQAWCANMGTGWRLPSRAELEGLTAGSAGETTPCGGAQCKVPGLFKLTGYWMWSGDRNPEGRAYYHYLHTTHTQLSAIDYRLNARALCVRPI